MGDGVDPDDRLVRYLLALVTDEEAERLDEASVVDDEVAARLRDAENDLIDAFVRGALDARLQRRFEEIYLSTRLRRERVAFARRFLTAVDRAKSNQAAAPARWFGRSAPRSASPAAASRILPGRRAAAS
jgi:hypothetical protein